ncbi:MAG: alpha/beta hydrolase [Bacteroidales bacterium]|nr:alpha/beta hydrolase [Bacteroidales bacterium]
MKRLLIALFCAALSLSLAAQDPILDLRPDKTVFFYADGNQYEGDVAVDRIIAAARENAGFKMAHSNGVSGPERFNQAGFLSNVSDYARMDLYFPAKPNGEMIVVCPGGGYMFVSTINEGQYTAKWLLEQGVTVAVVKYRLPNHNRYVPLDDVQNAFRYCRAHAQQWGVKKIGVMGFSAGGHLAASAATLFVDEATRPDFAVLIYPVITLDRALTHMGTRTSLLGADETISEGDELRYSLNRQVTTQTPRTFLALSSDDTAVPPANSILFYEACLANRVPAEMHIYPTGGHGWGFRDSSFVRDEIEPYRAEFFASLSRFLKSLED